MNAMLIVKTKNGYACAPYKGEIPADFVQEMDVARSLSGYSGPTVVDAMQDHFEKPESQVSELGAA